MHSDGFANDQTILDKLPDVGVTTFPACYSVFSDSCAGMHSDGFANDQTILDQLPDVLP